MTAQQRTPAFEVVQEYDDSRPATVLRTADWVEAETRALTPWPRGVRFIGAYGVHPSHEWPESVVAVVAPISAA